MLKFISIFFISSSAISVAPIEELANLVKLDMRTREMLVAVKAQMVKAKAARDEAVVLFEALDHCVGFARPSLVHTVDEQDMVIVKKLLEQMKGKAVSELCGLLMKTWQEVGDKRADSIVSYLYILFLDSHKREGDTWKVAVDRELILYRHLGHISVKIESVAAKIYPGTAIRRGKIFLVLSDLDQEKRFIELQYARIRSAIDNVYKEKVVPDEVSSPLVDFNQLIVELFRFPQNYSEVSIIQRIARSVSGRPVFEEGKTNLQGFVDEIMLSRIQEVTTRMQIFREYLNTL
jgi:hypothetical protein